MKRYHIGKNGPGICTASPGNCPFKVDGVEPEHYTDKKDAQTAYEQSMSPKLFESVSKNPLENLDENSWKQFGFMGTNYTTDSGERVYETLSQSISESRQDIKNLSDEEKEGLHYFTTPSFRDFNRVMFRRKNPEEERIEEYKKAMKQLDSAFENTPKKDKIVYRGMSGSASVFEGDIFKLETMIDKLLSEDLDDFDAFDSFDDLEFPEDTDTVKEYVEENLQLGSVVEFSGYQSTSRVPEVASKYGEGGIVFEIKTPEGINLSSLSDYRTEEEILLPRETRYKVVGVQEDPGQIISGGKYLVQLVAINDQNEVKTVDDPPDTKNTWEELMKKELYKPL